MSWHGRLRRRGWRVVFGFLGFSRSLFLRRALRHVVFCLRLTIVLTGQASLVSLLACLLVFRVGFVAASISILPVVFGALVFLGLGLVIPGLISRVPRAGDRYLIPSLFLMSVVGSKLIEEGTLPALVLIGKMPRTDLLWLDWRLVVAAWVVLIGVNRD